MLIQIENKRRELEQSVWEVAPRIQNNGNYKDISCSDLTPSSNIVSSLQMKIRPFSSIRTIISRTFPTTYLIYRRLATFPVLIKVTLWTIVYQKSMLPLYKQWMKYEAGLYSFFEKKNVLIFIVVTTKFRDRLISQGLLTV